jgi:hypothetical protein
LQLPLSLAINYLLLKFSFNLGSRNNLVFKQVRWTAHVKPSIGGISFFIIFLLSWGIYGFISQERGIVPDKQIIGIVAATSLGFSLLAFMMMPLTLTLYSNSYFNFPAVLY